MIPGSDQPLVLDTTLGRFLLVEQVEGNVADQGHIFRSMVFANARVIFIEGNIQHPVKLVFDPPVTAHGCRGDGGGSPSL